MQWLVAAAIPAYREKCGNFVHFDSDTGKDRSKLHYVNLSCQNCNGRMWTPKPFYMLGQVLREAGWELDVSTKAGGIDVTVLMPALGHYGAVISRMVGGCDETTTMLHAVTNALICVEVVAAAGEKVP